MNRRDLELLSSYLDGQLKPSDSARLETRLATDRDLRALFEELREARSLLRRLPARKAPRNFTLTRQMVGNRPPLPRAYPTFRFVTALATLLLFFTFGLNFMAPQLVAQPPALGMGGGAPEIFSSEMPATEAAAAPAEEPPAELVPQPTTEPPSVQDSARNGETPSEKDLPAEQPAEREEASPLIPVAWQIALAAIIIAGALLMLLTRQFALSRWRQER